MRVKGISTQSAITVKAGNFVIKTTTYHFTYSPILTFRLPMAMLIVDDCSHH